MSWTSHDTALVVWAAVGIAVGMSVGQTIATWLVMETILSVVGLAFVLLVGVFA